nr:hypothetical protein [uncultured Caproiciproducens sp.]
MPNYKEMYYSLFGDVTRAIGQLQEAQRKTEELYILSEEIPIAIMQKEKSADIPNIIFELKQ